MQVTERVAYVGVGVYLAIAGWVIYRAVNRAIDDKLSKLSWSLRKDLNPTTRQAVV
jgi:hypothetical protein